MPDESGNPEDGASPGLEPRVARGSPLAWSADAVANLSDVSDEDVAAARATWYRLAPANLRTILDAGTDDSEP